METNTLLIQTLIDKVDSIQDKFENLNEDKNISENINNIKEDSKRIIAHLEEIKTSISNQSPDKIIQNVSSQIISEVSSALVETQTLASNYFYKKWLFYGQIALSTLFFFFAINYSLRYYKNRGNNTKYEYILNYGYQEVIPDVYTLDSIYNEIGDLRFRIKYMEE